MDAMLSPEEMKGARESFNVSTLSVKGKANFDFWYAQGKEALRGLAVTRKLDVSKLDKPTEKMSASSLAREHMIQRSEVPEEAPCEVLTFEESKVAGAELVRSGTAEMSSEQSDESSEDSHGRGYTSDDQSRTRSEKSAPGSPGQKLFQTAFGDSEIGRLQKQMALLQQQLDRQDAGSSMDGSAEHTALAEAELHEQSVALVQTGSLGGQKPLSREERRMLMRKSGAKLEGLHPKMVVDPAIKDGLESKTLKYSKHFHVQNEYLSTNRATTVVLLTAHTRAQTLFELFEAAEDRGNLDEDSFGEAFDILEALRTDVAHALMLGHDANVRIAQDARNDILGYLGYAQLKEQQEKTTSAPIMGGGLLDKLKDEFKTQEALKKTRAQYGQVSGRGRGARARSSTQRRGAPFRSQSSEDKPSAEKGGGRGKGGGGKGKNK
jgi:hypothetical protein